jgi:phosphoglycerate dehydrogenase-like enzyme
MGITLMFWPPVEGRARDWPRRLEAAIPDLRVVVPADQGAALEVIAEAEAVYAHDPISAEALRRATALRWVQSARAGPPAGWYSAALQAHPAAVTNVAGIYSDHIAAHVMAYVLYFARGLHHYLPAQRAHEWRPLPANTGVVPLTGATALIVGVGGIGAEVARLCSAFGMRVLGVDARRRDPPPGMDAIHPAEDLDAVLPKADFVVVTVPETPATQRFMHAGRFVRMKRSAYFMNIGRGATVVLDDLAAALRAGTIAGAALDVYEVEPLPSEHPLWSAPNALLTPHTAAYGPHLDERRFDLLAENCRRFIAGEPLRNVVDKQQWF